MAWAGRRSENIASVYLLFHLFDKSDFAHFWEACHSIHLAPDDFSSQGDFETYVRDSLGFVLDDEHLRELRYQKAANDLALDLIFEGHEQEAGRLRNLPYGAGFAQERAKHEYSKDPEDVLQFHLLQRSYQDLTEHGKSASDSNEISAETLKRLRETLQNQNAPDSGTRYTPENLFASPDFRALAALRYIVAFSRKLGITSPLDPVLSYPLGVNAISLEEAVDAYQAFQDGGIYHTRFGQPQLYIQKITSADGDVIFEDHAEREQVLTDQTRYNLEAILGAVVRGGTGQQIGRELRLPSVNDTTQGGIVPAFGKTGTTNDYRNAAFLGYIAAPSDGGKSFDPFSGFVIGVYSGFDNNTPMSRPGFRGTGAMAAVPAWLSIAQSLVKLEDYSYQDSGSSETGEAPLFEQDKYKRYVVSRRTGLPVAGDTSSAPGYADDLSDEMSSAVPEATGVTSLWIREP